jgi:hypothetical protein
MAGKKPPTSTSTWKYFLIGVGSFWLFTPVFGGGASIFIMPALSLLLVYTIINSSSRVFELVPATKAYTVGNLFLFPVLFSLLVYLMLIVFGDGSLGIVALILLLTGHGKAAMSLFASAGDIGPALCGSTFILLVMLLAIFIITALSCIRNKKVRISAIAAFGICIYTWLYLLKVQITAVATVGFNDFFNGFGALPYANLLLLCTGAACVIALPVSVLMGMHLYKRRFAARA